MPTSRDTIPTQGPTPTAADAHTQPLPDLKPAGSAPGAQTVARLKVQRVDLLDMQQLDESTKDPNRHYRWTRGDRVNLRKMQGYEVETNREGGPKTIAPADDVADGTIRMGDLVLMSCPRDQRVERVHTLHKLNQSRIGIASQTTKDMARQIGVKIKDEEVQEEAHVVRPR
jgi:hypothetical protein